MATHFARGTLTEGHLVSARISSACHSEALKLPEHRRTRFLASRALLAELLFMLYGTSELPDILTQPEGRPVFADPALPHFSIAYTGNIVGVALTTEGDCGLDMELQRVTRSFHGANALKQPLTRCLGSVLLTHHQFPNKEGKFVAILYQNATIVAVTGYFFH